jgi:hypothetical protein
MAETERDEKVSAGYRALGSEEPPRALDDAILAASRRSPARWRVPLSIAAVLVLAVGVTLRMLPQKPDAESVALAPQVIETPRPASAPPSQPKDQPRLAASAMSENRARAEAAAPAAAPAAAASARRDEVGLRTAKSSLDPETWLKRIAELRKEGRQREADESLAEFRKRYPDFKIPETAR